MARISPEVSRSLDEYLIHAGYQPRTVTPDKVRLGGSLRRDEFYMPLGWFSAAMQCVSGDVLGIAFGQYGGCAVLPRSISIQDQIQLGKNIKKAKAGFHYGVITVSPNDPISKVMEIRNEKGYSSFPVVDDDGMLVGVITKKNYHPAKHADLLVKDRMVKPPDMIVGTEEITLAEANELLLSKGKGILPIVSSDGHYRCSVFWADIEKHARFPDEFVDKNGRYRFAGAVSTFEEDRERAVALVSDAACDILIVDTSNLKSDFGKDTIEWLAQRFPDIPIVAGNIIDEEGFRLAVDAGADVVKIGQGPGYGCTTREVKRTGRGQATAFQSVAAARDAYNEKHHVYVPLCGDGGIEDTGDMLVAYAMGMDFLMMGKYFGEFTESAAPLKRKQVPIAVDGKTMVVPVLLKEYWGEASRRAANISRYGYTSKKHFVPEGEEGLIPHRGLIHDPEEGINIDITFVKKSFSESGALTPRQFSQSVTLELQSSGSREEGRPKV